MLSVIIPAYNEQENIKNTTSVLSGILIEAGIDYELIYVDDGSKDETWQEICACHAKDPLVRGVRFSRNFGKEGAIFAGLRAVNGDCAVVIDCDLQHPPELIPQMYSMWENGVEVIEAVKASRGSESLIYKLFAKGFYKMMKTSSGINLDGASDFKLLDRRAVDALNEMPERMTFFRALSSWVGFRTEKVEFNVKPRAAGKTKWNFAKLFKFAINSITSFTNLPIHMITAVGVVFGIFALILGIQTLVNYFSGTAAEGFSTVILLILIVGACVMTGVGIIGFYLSKIYEEIKQRPRYIVSQRVGLDEKQGKGDKRG